MQNTSDKIINIDIIQDSGFRNCDKFRGGSEQLSQPLGNDPLLHRFEEIHSIIGNLYAYLHELNHSTMRYDDKKTNDDNKIDSVNNILTEVNNKSDDKNSNSLKISEIANRIHRTVQFLTTEIGWLSYILKLKYNGLSGDQKGALDLLASKMRNMYKDLEAIIRNIDALHGAMTRRWSATRSSILELDEDHIGLYSTPFTKTRPMILKFNFEI